jgi:hypothetical protein
MVILVVHHKLHKGLENMSIGTVRFNAEKSKYELVVGSKVIARSKDREYFEYHYARRDVPKLAALTITKFTYADEQVVVGTPPTIKQPEADVVPTPSPFSIDEKFEMMDELLAMVINGSTKAMLIGGKGGIGKTFAVMSKLQKMGKVDVNQVISESMADDISLEDSEDDIEEKVKLLASLDSMGDYKVIRGFVTPAAAYRLLYENRKRTIIFDDCDSVLRHDDTINLLKGALDTYEERWISWNTQAAASDLPPCFKFEGQIIFITNLPMEKIDEAVRTRCFKVDVAMSKAQRCERMESVLANVMPDVDMDFKKDALKLLRDNLEVAQDVSFRALMNLIKIRIDPTVKDWTKLGRFALIEN